MAESTVLRCGSCKATWHVRTPETDIRKCVDENSTCACGSREIYMVTYSRFKGFTDARFKKKTNARLRDN